MLRSYNSFESKMILVKNSKWVEWYSHVIQVRLFEFSAKNSLLSGDISYLFLL
ncbi:hypothetical protein LINPERHAP1_LOCUS8095 [Linum perenne]